MKLNSTGEAIANEWNNLWNILLELNAKENGGVPIYDPSDEDIFYHYGYGETLKEVIGIQLAGYREDALIRLMEINDKKELPMIHSLLPYFSDLTDAEKEELIEIFRG